MANQVTLTFAGETRDVESAFDRVGGSARTMDDRVRESADGFDRAGEAADAVDTKAMGFRDTMTGVQDSMKGASEIAKGNLFTGFFTLGMGIGDLGSGLYNFLIPSLKTAATALKGTAIAQWAMNSALLASPITWIVLAVVALVAIIVIIATKTDWFQRIWKVAWGGIKSAASAVWDWLKGLPGKIGGVFGGVAKLISLPFRTAFNWVADAWNNTVGKLSFRIPDWVPGIGGKGFDVPDLPKFHSGGIVPGAPGQEVVALLQAGERITPAGGGSATVIEIRSGGSRLDDALVELLVHAFRARGIRVVLGGA